MHGLSTVLRRAAEALAVTERDAQAAYLNHVREHRCSGKACKHALKLHDGWKRIETRENGRQWPPRGR